VTAALLTQAGAAMATLAAAVDHVTAQDLFPSSDRTAEADLELLLTLRTRVDAEVSRRLADLAERRGDPGDRELSAAGWLRHHSKRSFGQAAAAVRVARQLQHLPLTAAAHAAGRLTAAQVSMLARAAAGARADAYAQAEQTLVEWAQRLSERATRVFVEHWIHMHDPEVLIDDAAAAHTQRRFDIGSAFDGMVPVEGLLPVEVAEQINIAFKATAGKAGPHDERTPTQRRADAFAEIVDHYLAHGQLPMSGGSKPHLIAVADIRTIHGQAGAPAGLVNGVTPINGETIRRLACDAGISRVIVDPASEPINLGRETRDATPAQRRGLLVRDQVCCFPGCDIPAYRCVPHHLQFWGRDHGPTNLNNLASTCRYHHWLLHEGGWDLTREPDGWTARHQPTRTRLHEPDPPNIYAPTLHHPPPHNQRPLWEHEHQHATAGEERATYQPRHTSRPTPHRPTPSTPTPNQRRPR
jgi:hypothetical protein